MLLESGPSSQKWTTSVRSASDPEHLAFALAAPIAVVARFGRLVWLDDPDGVWFAYDPDSTVTFAHCARTTMAVREAGVWLVAIALRLALAWRPFRSTGTTSGPGTS
jgi:hypothetical protein